MADTHSVDATQADVSDESPVVATPSLAGVPSSDIHAGLAPPRSRADGRRIRRRLKIALVLWDGLIPIASLALAARVGGGFGSHMHGGPAGATDSLALMLALLAPPTLALAGAYNSRRRRGDSRLVFGMRLLAIGLALSWASIILSAAAGWPIDFAQMLVLAPLMPMGWLLGRWVCDHHPAVAVDRVLLIGSGAVADRVAEMTTRHGEGRLEIVGQVACGRWSLNPNLPQLGEISDVPTVLERHRIDRALVAFTSEPDSELVETLRCCVARGVQVDVIPRFYDLVGPTPRAFSLGRMALVEVPARGLNMSQRITKRAFDMFGSATLVLLFSPLLVVTAAATLLLDGPPIFFRQSRQGRGGRVFTLVKFRTMRPGAEQAVLVAAENARADVGSLFDAQKVRSTASITRLGRVLRRSSVDELPQLWNVFRGDMSLVGPRPLALYEADHLEGWHRARQDLRPGLTGLWQVSGRSDVGWQERMHLDYTYVSHWSLVSDLRILLRTVPAVFRGDGAI